MLSVVKYVWLVGHQCPMASGVLALYRPFMDPLRLDSYWLLLLLPLVLAISVTYKVTQLDNLADLPRESLLLAVQILVFMVLAATALWILTELA